MRDGWLEAETLETLRAATPKFEAKRHGASDHSNNCRLVPLANILPQTLQALLFVPYTRHPKRRTVASTAASSTHTSTVASWSWSTPTGCSRYARTGRDVTWGVK